MSLPYPQSYTLLDAVTADVNTSGPSSVDAYSADISGKQKLSVQFVCANRTSGNGVFKIWVSNDGTNWKQYGRLIDATATVADAHNEALVNSVTLSADGSAIYVFPSGDYFRYISASVDVTTDGKYSCILQAG